jgi:nucleoside-diphosphate-sugar epimerase
MSEPPVVLVTGGSGLLGSRLVADLKERYDVVSLDLDGDPESPPDVEFICTDLTSDRSVHRALERVTRTRRRDIASVVHLAAYYDFSGADSPLYEEVTVQGTARLLDALADHRVGQFVFSSTMLVHEPAEPGDRIDEADPTAATWPYPASKVETERVISANRHGIPTVVVRLAGVYDEDGHSPPIANQIRRIDGRSITGRFYPADLDRGQAFVHVDDAVDALARIVDRRTALAGEVPILVGEPQTPGYGDIQDLVARELGRPRRTWRIPAPVARLGAWLRERNPFGEETFVKPWMVDHAGDHYELDIGTARQVLGWEPRHRVLDVIPDMIARLRKDPEGWYRANGLTVPRRR